jgi:hypothetical protein
MVIGEKNDRSIDLCASYGGCDCARAIDLNNDKQYILTVLSDDQPPQRLGPSSVES